MGMWVRAGELKDVPEPQYTTENEARRIKSSRVDWRSSWLHEQCMHGFNEKPPPDAVGDFGCRESHQMKVQQEVDNCILVEEAVLTISRWRGRGVPDIVEARTVMV